MSALMIATMTIKNPEKFQAYLQETQKIAGPLGAKILYRGHVNQPLTEHEMDHETVVVVEFPSTQAIEHWINSDAYKAIIPLREEGAEMKMISYSDFKIAA